MSLTSEVQTTQGGGGGYIVTFHLMLTLFSSSLFFTKELIKFSHNFKSLFLVHCFLMNKLAAKLTEVRIMSKAMS